jgi:hypothetical protein
MLKQPGRRLLQRLAAAAADDNAVRRREARGDRVADAGGAAADQCGPYGDDRLPGLVDGAVLGLA